MKTSEICSCVLITALIVGCASPNWDGTIQQWGTVREVLRDGRTEGRVLLSEAVASPHAFGVGAMESLDGEVLIYNGQVWIGRAAGTDKQSTRSDNATEYRATLLAVAHVPSWIEIPVERDVAPDELDDYIAATAEAAGLDTAESFPFVIKGRLSDVDIHIINGQCPKRAAADPAATDSAPFRTHRQEAQGTIVGFYAPGKAGVLTHHGERSHAHVLVEGNAITAGHLDGAGIQQGAVLQLPKR